MDNVGVYGQSLKNKTFIYGYTTTTNMRKVKCFKCGYEWETTSKLEFVSCPSCLKKVKIKFKEEVK